MTRPDEIAALADELVGIQEELAIEEWRDALGKAAHHLRRLAATSPGDTVREVLRAHWLHQIVCNHEDGTDKPCCSCSMWNCPPQPSIGAAVEAWIDHVIQQLPVCGDTNLEVQRLLRKISDLAYDENASEPLDDAINYANKALAALAPAEKAGDGRSKYESLLKALRWWRDNSTANSVELTRAEVIVLTDGMIDELSYADLRASGGIFPEAYQQDEASMTGEQIKHMVDRFLMWKLPEHFNPDCGISFDQSYRSEHGPVGTNLFDATQADAMVRYMIDGLPAATPTPPSADVDMLRARIGWLREGYREISRWTPEEAASRYRQYSLDTLTGPTLKELEPFLIQSAAHGGGTDATWYRSGPVFGTYERITPSDPAQEPEAVAWVIHGDDNARSDGSLDAMAWQEGEFTRPLYAKPQARPVSLDREAVARAIKNGVYFDGDDREVKGFDDAADNVLALIEGRT